MLKKTILFLILWFSLLPPILNISFVHAKTWTVDDDGGADFQTIQEAINNASDGDIVFVHNGTYCEHVIVNKSISLVGENPATTIIDGNGEIIPIVRIFESNVSVSGFTVQNTASDWESYGILIFRNCTATVQGNVIKESYYGLMLDNSTDCKILDNKVLNSHYCGICLRTGSSNNSVIGNSIVKNPTGILIAEETSQHNTFYHNNIINNEHQAITFGRYNSWDNGAEGNYWSDYNGTDLDGDGIGDTDTPHQGLDRYPLMEPWGPTNIPPVADFTYNPSNPKLKEEVQFSDTSTDVDGGIVDRSWEFGDYSLGEHDEIVNHIYAHAGTYNVTLTVWDSEGAEDTAWKLIVIGKMETTITIYVPSLANALETIIVEAMLEDEKGERLSGENIDFFVSKNNSWIHIGSNLTKNDGNASILYTFAAKGEYQVKATYSGSVDYIKNDAAAEIIVSPLITTLSLNSLPTATQGQAITITAVLKDGFGNPVSNEIVDFYVFVDGSWKKIDSNLTDSEGVAAISYVPPVAGTFQVEARYSGSHIYIGSSADDTLEVSVGYTPLVKWGIVVVITVAGGIIAFAVIKKKKQKLRTSA